ncbi:MAG: hypothetical protein R6T96_00110 [Longimicrobiales bacterium]
MMLLLEIQDLRHQKMALLEEPGIDRMEEDQFKLDPEEAVRALDQKIDELTEGLDPAIKDRCQRGLPTLGRMVVPVIGGVCYGCFVSIPTSRTGDPNDAVQTCESCGRFIYVLS